MNLKTEIGPLLLVALAAFCIFANTLSGDFVYDDQRQILRNPLIQDSTQYQKALASDVWAFKGAGSVAASNYYRPTFIVWLILCFKLFGTNPFGWHLLNVLLHTGISLLGFLLLRKWGLSSSVSFAVALVFAVHPVHTESVAWISGSPDLLFAAALLGAFWFAGSAATGRKALNFGLAMLLYAVSLGAKESAMLCFPLFYLILAIPENNAETAKTPSGFFASPVKRTAVFGALAAIFFLLRWAILGKITLPVEDATNFSSALLTAPSVFVFYFRQMFFPLVLGENYPLRPVNGIGFGNFFLPLFLTVLILAALWFACRRSRIRRTGAAILLLPLLPVLNAAAFPSDQIVHDRYLYLPLFGALIIVFSLIGELLERYFPQNAGQSVAALALVLSIPLGIQTFLYNRTWKNNLTLWAHTAAVDPTSPNTFLNYGAELSGAGRYAEAIEAFDQSLKYGPKAQTLVARARNYFAVKRIDEAVGDLQTVIAMRPEDLNAYTLYQAYEALALIYSQTGNLAKASEVLREARTRLPIYTAALTEKLAVVLYQSGDKPAALKELETARQAARTELLPESKAVLLRLGMLYAETGRKDEARAVLQEYLSLTAQMQDNMTAGDRKQALGLLKSLQ